MDHHTLLSKRSHAPQAEAPTWHNPACHQPSRAPSAGLTTRTRVWCAYTAGGPYRTEGGTRGETRGDDERRSHLCPKGRKCSLAYVADPTPHHGNRQAPGALETATATSRMNCSLANVVIRAGAASDLESRNGSCATRSNRHPTIAHLRHAPNRRQPNRPAASDLVLMHGQTPSQP